MEKKKNRDSVQSLMPQPGIRWGTLALMLLFFMSTLLLTANPIKGVALILLIVTILCCLASLSILRDRLSWPMAAVSLWTLMNGVSVFYAESGVLALGQFLPLLVGFCVFLLILIWSQDSGNSGRAVASILEGSVALASLVSIDTISTHLLSDRAFDFMALFSEDSAELSLHPVEEGVRITSIYENPNVFAGVAGLGVLLALELALSSAKKSERRFHLVCLFLNALAFILVFSLGGSGMICLGFLAFILLERREKKVSLLVLMVETLVLALLFAFPIFISSFGYWNGIQPIPILCAVTGSILICMADAFVGQRLSAALNRSRKSLLILIMSVVGTAILYAVLALTVTGPAELAGNSLRRSAYPDPGTYTLKIDADAPVQVSIESQNRQETMMHTSTSLYSGDAQNAHFSVPDDSLVVNFEFTSPENVTLRSVTYQGEKQEGKLKLGYKLLPGFIANRLQGIFANENAIQRLVFFDDGLTLFRRAPIFGLGLGAFEACIREVQSFYYITRYVHNHYIETLATTGIVGLILFLGMLILCALALWKNFRRKEKMNPLTPALGGALVFMAAHAAVEVNFSFYSYLPYALGVLGLVCLTCGEELPLFSTDPRLRGAVSPVIAGLLTVFTVMLGVNVWMGSKTDNGNYEDSFTTFELASKIDLLEGELYKVSYVYNARLTDPAERPEVREKADIFAEQILDTSYGTLLPLVVDYYFETGQQEKMVEALNVYVKTQASDSETWQYAFTTMAQYLYDTPESRQAVADLYHKLLAWNENHMGTVELTEENLEFIHTVTEE